MTWAASNTPLALNMKYGVGSNYSLASTPILEPPTEALIRAWPPVAFVPSTALASALGVRVQRLRRWRSRGIGPAPESRQALRTSNPKPTLYRVSKLWCWLDGRPPAEHWIYERDWIVARFNGAVFGSVSVSPSLTPDETRTIAESIRKLLRYPDFRVLAGVNES